jgi:outer membrane protein TolC
MKHVTIPTILATTLALFASATTFPAHADNAGVPLANFEQKVNDSYAVRAAQALIDEDTAAIGSARMKAGPSIIFNNLYGPRHEDVPNLYTDSYLRYQQFVGIHVPLLGSRETQQEDIVMATADRTVAQMDYENTRLQLIAAVRENYIKYWLARQEQDTAQSFMAELNQDAPASDALRRNGFWTASDQMNYTNLIQKAKTDYERAELTQREALAQLGLATNTVVAPFDPVEPSFASCVASAPVAINSAFANDPELAIYDAQSREAQSLVRLQRWTGLDIGLNVGAQSFVDTPGGVTYGAMIGLDLAAPVHMKSYRADEVARITAQMQRYDLLVKERRAQLQSAVMVALSDRDQAATELAQAQRDERVLAEDIRESRVRFANVAPQTLAEIQTKAQTAYQTRVTIAEDQGAILLKLNDLLQIAPDSCGTAKVRTGSVTE